VVFRFGAALTRQERLFPFQEGLEVALGDLIHELFDPLAGLDPLAGRLVEGFGDVSVNPPVAVTGVKIECRMLLALLAAAVAFAAGAVLKRQRAAKKGFVGEELSGARTSLPFRKRALGASGHGDLLY
jgi:hypothetical protein